MPVSGQPSSHLEKMKRPKNLNLLSVKFPLSAIMSVGHRAAGVLLFLSLPYFLYLLQLSLTNDVGFALAASELQGPIVTLFILLAIWALAHHFYAGIRYFLLDLDIGIDKKTAQTSALLVMIAGFITFVVFAFILF